MSDLQGHKAMGPWWEIVLDVLNRVDGVVPWAAICQELGRQLRAPVTGHFQWSTDGHSRVSAYPLPDWFDLPVVAARAARLHPLAQHYAATRTSAPLSIEQVAPLSHPAAEDYLAEMREDAIDQHLWIPVQWGSSEVLVAGVCRPRDPFSAREHEHATTAQVVIAAVHAHCRTLSQCLPTVWSPEQRDSALSEAKLTPRQTAVLSLAAEGLTAIAIGHRLLISPRTVERHLQNAYERMGVRDRVSAVRRAEQAGLLRQTCPRRPTEDGRRAR